MSLIETENKVQSMLNSLMLSYSKLSAFRSQVTYYAIADFGVVIACMNRQNYAHVQVDMKSNFKDWRHVFIAVEDEIHEIKYNILWDLMRCGYMKWLRHKYPRALNKVLFGVDNLGNLIINKRLSIWKNKPKYKFLIEDNELVKKAGPLRELAHDPSFFDYMPEEDEPDV